LFQTSDELRLITKAGYGGSQKVLNALYSKQYFWRISGCCVSKLCHAVPYDHGFSLSDTMERQGTVISLSQRSASARQSQMKFSVINVGKWIFDMAQSFRIPMAPHHNAKAWLRQHVAAPCTVATASIKPSANRRRCRLPAR
jgi:hypothetical protein